jgi:cytochrome P450
LARQELIVGFRVILQRMTGFRVPKGQENLEFMPSLLLHPPTDLNIEFDRLP